MTAKTMGTDYGFVELKDIYDPIIVKMMNRKQSLFKCGKCGKNILNGECKCPIPKETHCPECGKEY